MERRLKTIAWIVLILVIIQGILLGMGFSSNELNKEFIVDPLSILGSSLLSNIISIFLFILPGFIVTILLLWGLRLLGRKYGNDSIEATAFTLILINSISILLVFLFVLSDCRVFSLILRWVLTDKGIGTWVVWTNRAIRTVCWWQYGSKGRHSITWRSSFILWTK